MPSDLSTVAFAALLPRIVEKINGPIALAFSYQTEDAAALHLLLQCGITDLEVFTLDTLKLFPETFSYHKTLEDFFHITITKYTPDPAEVKNLEAKLGDEWGMRASLENRHLCCQVRKVTPLGKILAGKSAWVTGLRAGQSVTRSDLKVLEYDEKFGLIKINPLFDWSDEDLSAYAARHSLPLNPLYAKGFTSIGCAPCTRAVKPGEGIRAGRWWWENPEHKECGLHLRKEG
ncbi:phosphoadenosine phosphosulfate reductase [Spirochaetia bacterium]|nr:phosphoadenosine phosphosulfate reductase [Spirochaetia bacterium]